MNPTIDPRWRATDTWGHAHRGDKLWSTCTEITDESYWCDGSCGAGEEHEVVTKSHWECSTCGEHITPGMRPPGTYPLPGQATYRVTGVIPSDGMLLEVEMLVSEDVAQQFAADIGNVSLLEEQVASAQEGNPGFPYLNSLTMYSR